MINLERYFENHLRHRSISAEEIRQYAEDHVGKLRALPGAPAGIAALLVPTEAAFDAFDGKLSARTTLQATQSGGTISKDEAVELIRTTVRQREGRVRDKFAKGSGPYAEFFPAGLMEFSRARIGQVSGLLDRLITAADKPEAILGPELLAEFQDLKTTFANARVSQVDSKGELAQARAEVAATRTVLELQLGKNLLAIAAHHLGHPERAVDYFDQSLLEDPTRNAADESPPPPAPVA